MPTDAWAAVPGRPYVTDTYNQATGITNTLALPDNTSGPTYDGFSDGYNVKMAPWHAKGDGTTDDSAALNACHAAAAAASPPRLVVAPPGNYLCNTTVTLKAGMVGLGGPGYDTVYGRTNFKPGMTDGTACLKGVPGGGAYLRNFSVDPLIGSPNPHPSTGNVKACIGLQMGSNSPAIITGTTKAAVCVVTTKYAHTIATGDLVTFSNMVGMTELESVATTATYLTDFTFSIPIDSSGYVAVGTSGLVRPTDAGVSKSCTRGVIENVTVFGCRTNFVLQGWLNKHTGLKSFYGTVGFDGSYLNTNTLDLVTENCYQAFQLLGCNGLHILRLEDEGGVTGDLGAASTIDFSQYVNCSMYSGEGTRNSGPWMTWGGVSYNREIHFPHGFVYEGAAAGVSIAVANTDGYTVPTCVGGISTTGSSQAYSGTATFAAATTVAVTIPTQTNTDYRVLITPQADPVGRLYVTGKTTTGFTITNTTSTSIAVNWQVARI